MHCIEPSVELSLQWGTIWSLCRGCITTCVLCRLSMWTRKKEVKKMHPRQWTHNLSFTDKSEGCPFMVFQTYFCPSGFIWALLGLLDLQTKLQIKCSNTAKLLGLCSRLFQSILDTSVSLGALTRQSSHLSGLEELSQGRGTNLCCPTKHNLASRQRLQILLHLYQ